MSSLSHGSNAEPDLVPMLDMVFQLITFFMLVINFNAASLDLDLKLPVIGSAAPIPQGSQKNLLVLNINKDGKVKVYGQIKEDLHAYIITEAQASLLAAQKDYPELKYGDELPTTVVIRADMSTTFSFVNKVLKECQEQGFRVFALRAMRAPPK